MYGIFISLMKIFMQMNNTDLFKYLTVISPSLLKLENKWE